MSKPKIILSPPQLELAANEEIILTKNAIITQVEDWLGHLSAQYQKLAEPYAGNYPELFTLHPKVSKGEKQNGLPWVILDYPRRFSLPQGCFAVRTMFWWGRYLSIRVLLSGKWLGRVPALQVHFKSDIQGYTLHPFDADVRALRFVEGDMPGEQLHYVLAQMLPIDYIHSATSTFTLWMQKLLKTMLLEKT